MGDREIILSFQPVNTPSLFMGHDVVSFTADVLLLCPFVAALSPDQLRPSHGPLWRGI